MKHFIEVKEVFEGICVKIHHLAKRKVGEFLK
jgi:hypothetical protein